MVEYEQNRGASAPMASSAVPQSAAEPELARQYLSELECVSVIGEHVIDDFKSETLMD